MFSSASSSSDHCYDFRSDENAAKWTDLFVKSLQTVQRQVHPSLTCRTDALQYIEGLILQLLGMLCASQPHTVQDVEERVQKTFPHPIDKWAIADAQNALEKGKKKSPLVLPEGKIHPLLVKEVLGYRVDNQVTLYIVAVLEYIAADILKLTGNYVKNIKHHEITCQDIKVAMCADKVLMDMFFQDDDVTLNDEEETLYDNRKSLTYEEIVKDLVLEETQFMRDLNMIIKVFRAQFVKLFPGSKDLEVIFSNILDVQSFTATLLSYLEDILEMTEEGSVPLVGGCFEELAEGAEFDVYEKYAGDMLKPNGRDRLNTLVQRSDATQTFRSVGHGFKDSVKYVLPKLLLGPIYHCLKYFDVIKALQNIRGEEDHDRESLTQALGVLHQLKADIERKLNASQHKRRPGESSLRFQVGAGRQAFLTKMNELQKSIDGWEGKDIGQSCNELLMDGTLLSGKSLRERYVFLFDGLIILTKQSTKRSSVSGQMGEYKLKEKYNMRKVDVIDREDTDGTEPKNAFELQIRDHPSILLVAKSVEDKNNWMAALVSLLTRSMLERMLDGILKDEEKEQPLRLPSPEQYRFAVEDSDDNIVIEENQDPMTDSPAIKGGTILKLVERLTYPAYPDPNFVRIFLTTYRSFCKPAELLTLLIERFEIPEPLRLIESSNREIVNLNRDDLKRFRKEYCKPIQIRVLNVLRHWVDQHWYDFEWDENLLSHLQNFLETLKGKAMRMCVETINKAIRRKRESSNIERQFTFEKQPPQVEWHLARNKEEFDLMTLHPIEIARQVTLLEFDLYRAVKPSEMVGSVWVKKDKHKTSPNLLRMIHHSTVFTFWLEKCIIEAENFEERVAIVSRVLEIMLVFQELNNFNGVLEIVSALNSAPVFRLEHTFEELSHKHHKLMKAFDEAKELNSDHFKKYQEKLRSINPPCVPFLGMYLTNILLTEEGNPDFLLNKKEGLINFSKRRKVAEITGEIQQYQNQPYCLTVDFDIRSYFEHLAPLGGMTEKAFNDYLYEKSLEIEPRHSRQPPKFERKRDYPLKSPGIKPMSSRHSTYPSRNHPTSLSPAPNTPSLPHNPVVHEEDNISDVQSTPPSPRTPMTPPHDSADTSVFAPVYIPNSGGNGSSAHSSVTDGNDSQEPPPIPPRKNRTSSSSFSEAPQLPPKGGSNPPPLPPRRDSSHLTKRDANLMPRANSMTFPRSATAPMPRRNSERDHPIVNMNGERGGSMTPELPPKTYRQGAHGRQASS